MLTKLYVWNGAPINLCFDCAICTLKKKKNKSTELVSSFSRQQNNRQQNKNPRTSYLENKNNSESVCVKICVGVSEN